MEDIFVSTFSDNFKKHKSILLSISLTDLLISSTFNFGSWYFNFRVSLQSIINSARHVRVRRMEDANEVSTRDETRKNVRIRHTFFVFML